jgi:quinol monooxygenase YgiN
MARVVIFTRLTALPGKAGALRTVLDELAVSTRAEPGCEAFVIHPARDDPHVILGYEVFADDDALTAHRATDGVARAREELDVLLVEPPAIVYAVD